MEKTEPLFEEAMEELKSILERLERGEDSLDQNIGNFRRGLLLAQSCQKKLDEAEMAVKKIEESEGLVREGPAPELEDTEEGEHAQEE